MARRRKKLQDARYSVTLSDASMLEKDSDVALTKDGMVQSDLTGEWVTPEENNKRPIAVMVNNVPEAMPQSGVESADVIYEMLEEGGISRFMCLFSDYSNLDKIGPVRSARYYYIRKAAEHQAVLCHWGYSVNSTTIDDLDNYPNSEHIDYLNEVGGFRSSDRVAPHNAYIGASGIEQRLKDDNCETTKNENFKRVFNFNVENVIVQFCEHSPYPDDPANSGWICIELVGSGNGYYATNGKIIPIKWKKDSIIMIR